MAIATCAVVQAVAVAALAGCAQQDPAPSPVPAASPSPSPAPSPAPEETTSRYAVDKLPPAQPLAAQPQVGKSTELTPGSVMYNEANDRRCSVGLFATDDTRHFIITAGHCGDVGDHFTYKTPEGHIVVFGEMVAESTNTNTAVINSADVGIIEITNPNVNLAPSPLFSADTGPVMEWEDVNSQRPTICRIGVSSGGTCGKFHTAYADSGLFEFAATSRDGDSGGPVYAYIDNVLHPIGVMSYNYRDRPEVAGAMEIASTLEEFGLRLI